MPSSSSSSGEGAGPSAEVGATGGGGGGNCAAGKTGSTGGESCSAGGGGGGTTWLDATSANADVTRPGPVSDPAPFAPTPSDVASAAVGPSFAAGSGGPPLWVTGREADVPCSGAPGVAASPLGPAGGWSSGGGMRNRDPGLVLVLVLPAQRGLAGVLVEVVHRVLDRADLLGVLVGDLDAELLLE